MPAIIGRGLVYCILALDLLLLLLSFGTINKRPACFAIPLILLVMYFISMISAENSQLISDQGLMGDTLLKNLLAFITIYNLSDTDKFLKYMRAFSVAAVVIGAAILIGASKRIGYMAYGYRLVLASTFLFADYLNNKTKYFSLGLGLLGTLCILLGGSRGAVLICAMIFPLWLIFCEPTKNKIKWGIVFIFGIVILYFGFDDIISWVLAIMKRFNLNSRTIRKLLNNTVTDDTSRTMVWKFCIDNLFNRNVFNTLFGYGVAGDRVVILEQFGYFLESGYPHNIILEVLMQFGLMGIFVILWWSVNFHRAVKKAMMSSDRIVLIVLAAYCIQLFVSSSYIQNPVFFALTAWCLSNKYRLAEREAEKSD